MSRIGNKPIVIPEKVELTIDGQAVSAKGPKGTLSATLHPSVSIKKEMEDGKTVLRFGVSNPEAKSERAQWGTARAIVQNMVDGVTTGFTKSLEVIGVGYRANVQGSKIVFDVGYSHPVDFPLPQGVTATVEKNVVTLAGADRQLVGETAARIRKIRKPEPYKGTGIKYADEVIRRKAGKTGKAAAA
jgi:large subunit ribosomal protein L6